MTEKRIQKLSPLLINQIAAGEVVTRPASVVKELLENAIDAHATHIRIDIEQGGLGLIQISDNGHGIHPDDMTLAVTRHATSKLADVGELTGIDSLGFRGEALASICAVSHLTLTSSHNDTGIGQQLSLSGQDVSHATIRPVVKTQGTTVSVRDLYFNVPARRSHLKSIATEFAQIEQVVQRLAISFADIGLELYHQNKLRLTLNGLSGLNSLSKEINLNRLENTLNLPLANIATPFELSLTALQPSQNEPANITGWLFNSPQNLDLPKFIYINQRLVSDLAISQALAKSARQVGLENSRFGYALFFNLPKDWINVNIHPSKQQVKIQPLTNILALLNQKVQEILKNQLSEKLDKIENLPKQTVKNTAQQKSFANSQSFIYPNTENTQPFLQVNEQRLNYQFEENHSVSQNSTFSAEQLFDNSPKFLKIMDDEKGLIFWQNSFYAVKLDLLTQDVLADNIAFEKLLNNSEILTVAL